MKLYLVAQILTESVQLEVEHLSQSLFSIHMEGSRAPQKSERTEHAYQSETMVAMQMRYEDVPQLVE